MKKSVFCVACFLTLIASGCSTIMNKKKQYHVTLNCIPSADLVLVTNDRTRDTVYYGGGTSIPLTLKGKHAFFKRARYRIHAEKSGFEHQDRLVKPKIHRWYWANIPLGVIWMITIDPATGKMYEFRDEPIEVRF
jgi:hypothetical protein